jgi:hypothetical protein
MERKRITLIEKMKKDCRLCEHFSMENGCQYPHYAPAYKDVCKAWEMNHFIVAWGKQQYISGSNDCHKALCKAMNSEQITPE